MNVKAGDKVVIIGRYSRSIGIVKNITPNGNIRLTNGTLYTPSGAEKTKDVWAVSKISLLTPELEAQMQKDATVYKALDVMHKTQTLSYTQAVGILKILEGGDSE